VIEETLTFFAKKKKKERKKNFGPDFEYTIKK
jgi:hypothetical protein